MTTLVQFAQYYVTLFTNLSSTLNTDTFYGDQTKIQGPRTICVETDTKRNTKTRAASARYVDKEFRLHIYTYCNRLADKAENRLECDNLAETVETEIYKRPRCGGLVMDVNVETVESGYVNKAQNGVIAASRLTVVGRIEEILPTSVE